MNGSDRRIFALSVHADYACRPSGACCTAGWSIPVEPLRRGLLGADVLAPQADGACGYFDRETRLCRVHRDHGPAMMPASCHHFPRRALGDDRGLFVTLSHFRPTAAGLLFRADVALEIVRDPRAFPSAREYEGLDGRGEWPPLVRPDLLFDLASYDRWERFLVDTFSDERATVVEALARVAAGAERLRAWKPACGPFAAWTDRALRDVAGCLRALDRYAALAAFSAFRDIAATVPSGLSRPARPPDVDACSAELVAPCWNDFSAPVRRDLATKAFGSWAAYEARGVRTLVAELVASEMVLRVEAARACAGAGRRLDRELLLAAIRASDGLLVHLVDRPRFMRFLGRVETTESTEATVQHGATEKRKRNGEPCAARRPATPAARRRKAAACGATVSCSVRPSLRRFSVFNRCLGLSPFTLNIRSVT